MPGSHQSCNSGAACGIKNGLLGEHRNFVWVHRCGRDDSILAAQAAAVMYRAVASVKSSYVMQIRFPKLAYPNFYEIYSHCPFSIFSGTSSRSATLPQVERCGAKHFNFADRAEVVHLGNATSFFLGDGRSW
jgi:hypothetical protein